MSSSIAIAIAQGIQTDNLLFDLVTQCGLVFLDQLGLESADTITEHFQFMGADGDLHGLAIFTVAPMVPDLTPGVPWLNLVAAALPFA